MVELARVGSNSWRKHRCCADRHDSPDHHAGDSSVCDLAAAEAILAASCKYDLNG
jgi:hypothetical protein